jgi:tetratricopeptide (TPR) repeat protein
VPKKAKSSKPNVNQTAAAGTDAAAAKSVSAAAASKDEPKSPKPTVSAGKDAGSPKSPKATASAGKDDGSPKSPKPAASADKEAGSPKNPKATASAGKDAGSPKSSKSTASAGKDAGSPKSSKSTASAGKDAGSPKSPMPTASPGNDASKSGREETSSAAGEVTTSRKSQEPSAAVAEDTAVAKDAEPSGAPGPTAKEAASQDPAAARETEPKRRPSNILVGLCLAVIGVSLVGVSTLFTRPPTRDQDVPYLLEPLEKHLDANLRYKPPLTVEHKDWRSDFVTEQLIWTNEISKIMLGAVDAKPIENKRDFMLYLADSYFKDEPHFEEAKAAYLTASATPRIAHLNAYDYSDDELWRRLGYCDMRLGHYDEAETWLKKALKINEDAAKIKPDQVLKNTRSKILDNLAENYSRKGEPREAEETINMRLHEMSLADASKCVEIPVLFNLALAKEKEGDLGQAESFYKLAIKQCGVEDLKRGGVVAESADDNNRSLARVLMSYSHLLRLLHRNDEAVASMRRALCIYDNPPP